MDTNVSDGNADSRHESKNFLPIFDTGEFIYSQLFELMKLDNSRRENLDSKAQTYIGLLSIAITLLGVMAGFNLEYVKSHQPVFSHTFEVILLLYVCTEAMFIVGAIFALQAYHVGSKRIKGDEGELESFLGKLGCLFNWDKVKREQFYIKMDTGWLVSYSNVEKKYLYLPLILHLSEICNINSKLNYNKSNKILIAYYCTMIAIFLLLALSGVVCLYGTSIK